jgi:pyruvate formate-lyase activating enzyme-like uncharacterized protein
MVLLVTGKCNTGCFYCPVSAEKKGKDVIYANEMKISNLGEIINEAEAMEATGTGITGGDPLIAMDRTLEAVRILKEHFGKSHHIHLYTSMMDPEKVTMLQKAGLDEIRFHPSPAAWSNMDVELLRSIVKGTKMDVGIEVPAIPGYENELGLLITSAVSAGVKFINLNELEFSESNWDMMATHDFEINDELSASVMGSEETALGLMKKYRKAPIHFCSSVFKDGVQLRNRLIRRANHIAKEYDVVTEDGTLLKGVLYAEDLDEAFGLLSRNYKVPDKLMFIDTDRKRLEVAPWVLEEIAKDIPYLCYVVEEYSTADKMEVERKPLNRR